MPESKSRMRSKEYNLNPTEAQTGGRFRRGKMAPRIHTRVTERGRVSRREARFNHRTGSAATEGEREREGERVREIEGRGECMREAPEKGAGASNGRAISQDAEPTPAACDIAPFTRDSFTTLHTHTHITSLSLTRSPLLDRSFPLSLPNRPNRTSFLLRGVLALIVSGGCGIYMSLSLMRASRPSSLRGGLILSLSLSFSHPHRASSLSLSPPSLFHLSSFGCDLL